MHSKNFEIVIFKAEIWRDSSDPTNNQLTVHWGCNGVGFGCMVVRVKGSKMVIDSECMSDEFVKAVFDKMLSEAIIK